MKHLIIALSLCLSLLHISAQTDETIDNQSVIDLTLAGISKKIILNKIESSNCKFTTDTKSLINLKKNKVPEDVINAMIEKAEKTGTVSAKTVSGGNKPLSTAANPTPKKQGTGEDMVTTHNTADYAPKAVAMLKNEGSGIYYYQPSEGKIYELESNVFSQQKNNRWATALSYGFAKTSKVMSVSGSEANVQFNTKNPVFYFYFDPENKSLNAQAPTWFASVTSPNEFLLIYFENKKVKNARAVTTASANAYEDAQGIDDKYKASFKFKRIEKGIYELYFEKGLESGEYGFMYAGATATQGGGSPKVYDFGVK